MTETRTAAEVADKKLHDWEIDEKVSQMGAEGHARRRYREIVGRMASVVEFKRLIARAMKPLPLTSRELVNRGVVHDFRGRQQILHSRSGLPLREAERTVRDEHPALTVAVKVACDNAESDGVDLAQIRRELGISAECVESHVQAVIEFRRLARLKADAAGAQKGFQAAKEKYESTKREMEIAELDCNAARQHSNECAGTQNSIMTLESECPILFEGESDYRLPPAPSNGKPSRRERAVVWVGSLFRRGL